MLSELEKPAAVSGCSKEANVRQIFFDSVFMALLGTFSLISWQQMCRGEVGECCAGTPAQPPLSAAPMGAVLGCDRTDVTSGQALALISGDVLCALNVIYATEG